jgi:hypothetical protein
MGESRVEELMLERSEWARHVFRAPRDLFGVSITD